MSLIETLVAGQNNSEYLKKDFWWLLKSLHHQHFHIVWQDIIKYNIGEIFNCIERLYVCVK